MGAFSFTLVMDDITKKWTSISWVNAENRAYRFHILDRPFSIEIPIGSGQVSIPPDLQPVVQFINVTRPGGIVQPIQIFPPWQCVGL